MNVQAVKKFIKKNARPVDLAFYNYCFENGTSKAVVKELLKYQNPDGGFGHALEADNWNPNSTPITTNEAIIRLNQVNALKKEDKWVTDIIRYLKSEDGFDKDKKRWFFSLKSNNDYPHAVWWVPEEGSDGINEFNPTVSLATFIVCYGEDDGYYAEIVKEAYDFLAKAEKMSGDNLKCFMLSYDLLYRNEITDLVNLKKAKKAMQKLMLNEICKDVSKYGKEYATTSADFFIGRYWQFYTPEFDALIHAEIDNLANIQLEDGGFDIFWQWYNDYPEFAQAGDMWRPKVSFERLMLYEGVFAVTAKEYCERILKQLQPKYEWLTAKMLQEVEEISWKKIMNILEYNNQYSNGGVLDPDCILTADDVLKELISSIESNIEICLDMYIPEEETYVVPFTPREMNGWNLEDYRFIRHEGGIYRSSVTAGDMCTGASRSFYIPKDYFSGKSYEEFLDLYEKLAPPNAFGLGKDDLIKDDKLKAFLGF